MDRRIRQVAALITILFLVIAGMVGWIQGIAAESIANRTGSDPTERAINPFRIYLECRNRRGDIVSLDGQVLAESVPTDQPGRCLFDRTYPSGDLVPHVVGQWSLFFGKTGLEAAYSDDLFGEPAPPSSISDLFSERPHIGNTLVSTIDTRLQRVALDALDGRRGGVVALNPKTGAVIVAASVPSYDPNPLASLNRSVVLEARCDLGLGFEQNPDGTVVRDETGERVPCENPRTPLVSVALQSRRPPGSSFKVVTAAAALESGDWTSASGIPSTAAYTPPGATRPIHNYGGGPCGGPLSNAIRISCNTAMARVAVDIGADQFLTTAHAMGLDQFSGPGREGCDRGQAFSDIRETYTGCLPSVVVRPDDADPDDEPEREPFTEAAFRALAGFGQGPILTSPFGMAIVTGTIANQGFVPSPRFAERVEDRLGNAIREIRTSVGAAAMSTDSATQLSAMMRSVVSGGTASRAFGGFRIPAAGKTGTADEPSCTADQVVTFGERCSRMAHTWFIAFAPVDDPTIAIAVFVERGGGIIGGTGGRIAAPIARTLLENYFRLFPAAAGTG